MLSREAIVEKLIARLDFDGTAKLTLRGVAADLNTGAASLYWYARNKEQLLHMASDELVERALADFLDGKDGVTAPAPYQPHPQTSSATGAALAHIRRLIACLLYYMKTHPWLSTLLSATNGASDSDLRFWEQVGQQLAATELNVRQQFDAAGAIVAFAVAAGDEMVSRADAFPDEVVEDAAQRQADHWAQFDPEEFPFLLSVVNVFADHDDVRDFYARLDLLLAGVEQHCRNAQNN